MMQYDNICSLYESVAELTNQMLLAARNQDWDALSELEIRCADYNEQIRDYADLAPLNGDAQARKLKSIKLILANDREIRDLMAPWMMKLNSMLNNNRQSPQQQRI
jgi:flagellar protein FliT